LIALNSGDPDSNPPMNPISTGEDVINLWYLDETLENKYNSPSYAKMKKIINKN
jgi:hypothetical protein